ncbi:MerR family transcriptional regulator [Lactobacillus sp. PV037]|uniref:MerR family transcriptional regulator n=1 Tax=unclassified Lactobacillus TaxID=2620435 RepID=UPI002240D70B|nr:MULTISPECIES: MerR family transcriptional regulator [unclassified Lactobacillus]QNQ82399.1 MerR family transcriptional regulator [Lactobacillus sp. PV012]QNQ83488.1 MerR family transcriptional regulator [Lactobacillus sp. PV037]
MELKDTFFSLAHNTGISIGEVSNVVGVSPRQLRYWEQKGYIAPLKENSGVRRYNLITVYFIAIIKHNLDEGYTLAAAYERAKDVKVKRKIMSKFFKNEFEELKITDPEKGYGEIEIGDVSDNTGKEYELKAIVDEKGSYYKLIAR